MQSMPLRRLVGGPEPAPDRVAYHALWFTAGNNPRYEELLPRLTRLDPYLVTLPDRWPVRGIGWRAWMRTQKLHQRLILGALGRRYRSFFATNFEQLAAIDRPVVIDVDDTWWSEREAELLSRPNVAAYVVTAERAARKFEELGVEKPWHVIPQGVGLDLLAPERVREIAAQKAPGEVVVGFVAAMVNTADDQGGANLLYNVDHLLELWEEIHARAPEARLWLIGAPGAKLRERLAGREDVALLGRLDRRELLARVANLDLALYPRLKGAGIQAVKIAEYMGLGVPTVAYDYPVTKLLEETGSGVLAATPAGFVEAVVRLVQDADERRRLAEATKRAGAGLDWRVLAAKYDEILDQYLP
jgi:glycosyltransferase involved in cell wall biosynthesis